jgi:two-component system OmpR family response regulator
MSRAAPVLVPVRSVLVVDDDRELRDQVTGYLREHGYSAQAVPDATEMERILASTPVDMVILDVRLPGEDGLSVCQRLSASGGPAIIILSGLAEEVDRILGLELGADGYLAKPCSPRELLAHVRAVFRRMDDARMSSAPRLRTVQFAGFSVDPMRRQLRAPDGTIILLTSGEFSLLTAFLDHPQRILSRDQLLEAARGSQVDVFDRAVDVQISRLRRKLNGSAEGEIIKTVRGLGYLFDAKVIRP